LSSRGVFGIIVFEAGTEGNVGFEVDRRIADHIPSSYLKKLVNTDEIWEVRVVVGNNIFRLLGFFDGPKLIVLNHAFQKKTQKTPPQVIKIAEARKKDYFERRK